MKIATTKTEHVFDLLKSIGADDETATAVLASATEAKAEKVTVLVKENTDGTYSVAVDGLKPKAEAVPLNKAITADEAQRYTLAPWYPPGQLDAHGEWSDRDEVEKSFRAYMSLSDSDIRLQHNTDISAGRRVDGVVWPFEVTVPMHKSDGSVSNVTFPAGTPFMGTVWEPWAFDMVLNGDITGYSIGGTTKKLQVDIPVESLMKAEMSGAEVNDLPDSDFAYIEPGGTRDASGKTVPRSNRHFPIHDEAHVRNALARMSQSPFGAKAGPKIMAAAHKMGIGDH